MNELIEKINLYNEAYYQQNTSLISDLAFDQLLEQLQKLEAENPLFANPSLTLAINEDEDYHLKQSSPAVGFGQVVSGGPSIPFLFDMDGKNRSNPSTIGCYE